MKIKWNGIENMIYYYNVYFIITNNNIDATTAIVLLLPDCGTIVVICSVVLR